MMNIYGIKSFIKGISFDIKYGVQNLIRWFPIVWGDRDWDYRYLYEILRFKLNNIEKELPDAWVGSDKEAKHVKKCVYLLNRLIADDYHEIAYKGFYKKWGKPNFKRVLKPVYPNDPNDEKQEERDKEYKRKRISSEYLNNQDLEMLFDIMKKHIRNWWT